jgi:hypothetical protein
MPMAVSRCCENSRGERERKNNRASLNFFTVAFYGLKKFGRCDIGSGK